MKGIITLLIFICLFQGGVAAQKEKPKKIPAKKEASSPKKKVDKAKVAVNKRKDVQPKLVDSVVISEDEKLIVPSQQTDTVNATSDTPYTPAVDSTSDWQTWIPWLSLVLMLIMIIYIFWRNANIHGRINSIKNQLAAQNSDLQWQKTKPLLTGTEIQNLINESATLKKIQEELSVLRSNIEKLQQPAAAVIPVIPIAEPQSSTFYMTGPTNNYFPSSARSDNRENTVYKFMLQSGGNEALFEVHTSGANINEIIKVVESYIKPACDEENLPSSGTRNIVTRKPGRAILENEKWIIKDKAVIRYE